ncbi:MAG: tyrosine--tRNA ligase [Flavobacteriales bacterium]|nr:tyrosine--tRNA ligase [Flavobacteriales bacterium]
MKLIDELRWRGLLHDVIPGTEDKLESEMVTGYVGFDPTADSLHIGNMVPIMLLVHLQRAGHKPIALVGGATGMVGDPSGKDEERKLLDVETLNHNLNSQKAQLEKFLDFDCGENSAEVVNNYDWFKDLGFLDFIRDVGKHITVNYMMAKDSVKNRLDTGMSFTEFSYQLVQGYDFFHLWKHKNCILQMGGSDQWGNITTGTELIRRMGGGEAFAMTAPLVKRADGKKFGKSESGNVWIDPKKTSPYEFYQYWVRTSDEDAASFIRIFTLKEQGEIEALENEHNKAPHERKLQKELARDITVRVHGEKALQLVEATSTFLFGKPSREDLEELSSEDFDSIFSGVPHAELSLAELNDGVPIAEALAAKTGFLASNSEARRALMDKCVQVNTQTVDSTYVVSGDDLIHDKYLLLKKGKKAHYVISVK